MVLVEYTDASPSGMARPAQGRAGEAIEFSADQMAQGMARKCVGRQQDNVHQHDQGANADSEFTVEIEREDRVIPEKGDEYHRDVKEVAVHILQDERKRCFTAIVPAPTLTHGARRRVQQKSAVNRFAVVIAGSAETQRPGENQYRRRKRPPVMLGGGKGRGEKGGRREGRREKTPKTI